MELLDQIETYLAQHRMPPSKFGRLAVGDPRFVEDLRGGRLPRARTCDRVKRYLDRWTAGIPETLDPVALVPARGDAVTTTTRANANAGTAARAGSVDEVAAPGFRSFG